jgi:hypothetical protein
MGDKDPESLTTEEVAEMARKAGIRDTEHKTKEQMLGAIGLGKPETARAASPGGHERSAPSGRDFTKWKDVPGGNR